MYLHVFGDQLTPVTSDISQKLQTSWQAKDEI